MEEDQSIGHEEPEEKLKGLKDKFSKAVLANDLLFAAIKKELERYSSTSEGQNLTDFHAEPYRPLSRSGEKQPVGIRVTQSARFEGDDVPGLSLGMGIYGYVSVVDVDFIQEEAALSEEFLPGEGSPDERKEVAHVFWDAYMEFLRKVAEEAGGPGEIAIDHQSGTFELKEILDRTMNEDEFEQYMQQVEAAEDGPAESPEGGAWLGNMPTDPDDQRFPEGLDTLENYRRQYGSNNIFTTRVSRDPATGGYAYKRGVLGIWRFDQSASDEQA